MAALQLSDEILNNQGEATADPGAYESCDDSSSDEHAATEEVDS